MTKRGVIARNVFANVMKQPKVPKQSRREEAFMRLLRFPFAASSLPLRFTQSFDSGLRLRASAHRNDENGCHCEECLCGCNEAT